MSASEQTSASLPDDCQDYLRGNEPCAFAPGNCKKCSPSPQQQPDTMNDAVLKRQSEMMGEIAKVGWNSGQPDQTMNPSEPTGQQPIIIITP